MKNNFKYDRSLSIRKYKSNIQILNNKDFYLSNDEISRIKSENLFLKIKYNL